MANLQVFMLILIEVGSYASLRFCAAHGSDSLLSNKHSEKTAEKTEGKDCLSWKKWSLCEIFPLQSFLILKIVSKIEQ